MEPGHVPNALVPAGAVFSESSGTFQNTDEYRLSILRSWALGICVLKVLQVIPMLRQAGWTVAELCHMPGSISCWVAEPRNGLVLAVFEAACQ